MNFDHIQKQINELADNYDIKTIELGLMESELQDTLKPNILLSELSQLHIDMLMEVNEYIKKHKETDRIRNSKARLMRLFDISTQLNVLGSQNQSLKLFNRELVTRIQLLRVENQTLKQQLKAIEDAANF